MASNFSPETRSPALSVVASADYIEDMYERWRMDPASVADQWRHFFTGFDLAMCPRDCVSSDTASAQSKVASLIFAYRSIGHLIAQTDPLGDNLSSHPELEPGAFDLGDEHLDQVFDTGHLGGPQRATLREIIDQLRDTYCSSIGVEYLHIQDRVARRWLQERMEPVRNRPEMSRERCRRILEQLVDAEIFETFNHSRFPGQKRFSLEGAESLIPALHSLLETAADTGAEEVVMGMSHRGRLNVLANILQKPYQMIFHEFEDTEYATPDGGGDVKYHRGYTSDYTTHAADVLHLSLTANPSHLEAVDPVVEGRARAKQRRRNDTDRRTGVIPLLLHGDAAFAGQGLVAETLNLSQLKGYRTGGTVHIVINNQIGFTTLPGDARSSRYPTDVAKLVEAPIFHVNGDDPKAVVWVTELALRYRQEFGRDVVVDMICYRKHGHNEGDEPAFTQPVMYQKIKNRPTVREIFQLELEGTTELSLDESNKLKDEIQDRLYEAFRAVREQGTVPEPSDEHAFGGAWSGLNNPYTHEPADTAVSHEVLVDVGRAMTTVPDGFNLNRKIARKLPEVMRAVEDGGGLDWGTSELLAFGALLHEGTPVRISGQDSIRGTFSQRHAAWWDTETQEMYIPLAHIHPEQARFCAYNSMLSEAAVLGFDYGYSLVEPNMLVVWEAQFGDFANGAQVIIDQFIAAALDKWQRGSGLVMLLPHGYEGQGPEHSSAYLERYLQLCAEDNIQVCNLTTPAQYFHALRRQLRRNIRRPLVVMSPKSLLRHKRATSSIHELADGRFREILADPAGPDRARSLILCTGKVYYDLVEGREEHGAVDAAIVRVEQLYPFHREMFDEVVAPHRDAERVLWVQEETRNRGAWSYMMPILYETFGYDRVSYVGREPSASPATGSHRVHVEEQRTIVREALGVEE